MTPEDKAMELILRYYNLIPMNTVSFAKQCALIAVDLIIYHTEEDSSNIPLYEYYKEVRQEIEKL